MAINEKNTNIDSARTDEAEQMALLPLVRDVLHRLKRFWWVIVLTTAIFAFLFYHHSSTSYAAHYVAEATVSVEIVNGGHFANQNTAEQMGIIFPYILTSGALSDVIAADLGTKSVPATIQVTSIRGTNLLTISVTGRDPDTAYAVLQSVLRNYPEVAKFVVGQTELTVIDDSGIPQDTGKSSVLRGSAKRGAFIGFAFGLLLLLLYTISTRTIRSEEELRTLLNVPCLGSLPYVKRKRRSKENSEEINILFDHNYPDYTEAIRLVRTRLERQLGDKRVLMVTSSIPGEGKSTVAANLAVSIAQKGKRVALIDCDLRSPSQGNIFRLGGSFPGLGAVLKGEAALDDAITEVTGNDLPVGLTVLPGGDSKSRSVEIMGSEDMGSVIERLKERADLIILDTPPSAMLVDAMILARHADGVMYVVMNDYAKRRFIFKGIEELSENSVPVLGCLLNGSSGRSNRYGYYRYGHYGHYGRYSYEYSSKSKDSRKKTESA